MPDLEIVLSEIQFGLKDLKQVAKHTIKAAAGFTIWLLEGEVGAGKTTLVKAIAEELGVTETVSSPTFSIVNEYTAGSKPIYHFDFYRLKKEEEAYDIGVDEYLDSGNLCWIEWADKIPSLLPEKYFTIKLEVTDPHSRRIHYARH